MNPSITTKINIKQKPQERDKVLERPSRNRLNRRAILRNACIRGRPSPKPACDAVTVSRRERHNVRDPTARLRQQGALHHPQLLHFH